MIGIGLAIIGTLFVLVAWVQFRKPGVSFWAFAPVWKARDYLNSPGPALWIIGIVIGWLGVLWIWLVR